MSTNPFDTVIAAAEQREAEDAQAEAERWIAAETLRQERAAQAAAEREAFETKRRQELLRRFGQSFLNAVATRVVKPGWKPDFIRLVQSYSEGLLMQHPVDLPKIDSGTATAILDRFEYGITLYSDVVPDGFFYGQRLLAECEATKAEKMPERLHIPKGSKPKVTVKTDVVSIDEARKRLAMPATTPKTKKVPARYRKSDTPVASTTA